MWVGLTTAGADVDQPTSAGADVGADVGQCNYSRISLTKAGSEVGQPNSTTGADVGQLNSTTGIDVSQPNSTTGVDVTQPNSTAGEDTGQPNSSESSPLLSSLPLLTYNACNSVYLLYVSFGNDSPLTPFLS